jgi:hypothetical protein
MPDTAQAVTILVIAVLPGALYTWAFEREVGRWGIGLSDRLLRFIGASAVFQLLFALPFYVANSQYRPHQVLIRGSEDLSARFGDEEGWNVFLAAGAYVALPLAAGTLVANAVRSPRRSVAVVGRVAAGRDPAPRAWDFLFSPRPAAIVRGRLKDTGVWIGGLFAEDSYAAGYPEAPQDLYIEAAYRIGDDGTFARDANGRPVPVGSGILIRWDELEFLEVFPEEME